jgi:hypothetical protein
LYAPWTEHVSDGGASGHPHHIVFGNVDGDDRLDVVPAEDEYLDSGLAGFGNCLKANLGHPWIEHPIHQDSCGVRAGRDLLGWMLYFNDVHAFQTSNVPVSKTKEDCMCTQFMDSVTTSHPARAPKSSETLKRAATFKGSARKTFWAFISRGKLSTRRRALFRRAAICRVVSERGI